MLRIAVDFDGTIHDPTNVKKGYKMGQPIKDAQIALKELKRDGAIIVIHSVWADTEQKCQAMAEWCRYFDIPYDFITNQKPDVDCYIDNKGYHFENWSDTLRYLSTLNQER